MVDGQLYHEETLTIEAHNSWESVLSEFPPNANLIQASFGNADLLALDNVATAAVPAPSTRRVLLVGARTEQIERALKAVPGIELTKVEPQKYDPAGGYDVYVFEGWYPLTAPPGHWLLIDPPARGSPINVTGTLGRRTDGGKDVNDAHIARVLPSPLLAGVDLTGVGITEAKKVRLPEWAEEVVSGRDAPLIMLGFPRPYRAVVFTFDLRSTNLFGRIGFPVLIANTVNWLTGETTGIARVSPGSENEIVPGDALLIQPLPRAKRVEIETPAKRKYTFEGNDAVRFQDTVRPGPYTVTQFDGTGAIAKRTFVATVLPPGRDAALGDLKPRADMASLSTVTGPKTQPVVFGPGVERTLSEWWRPIGVLVLVALVAEWWWFHK